MLVALMALVLSATAAPAQEGPYRPGMPETLERPVQTDPHPASVDRFRKVYAAKSRPRIMVLWNREVTDELGSAYRNRETEETTKFTEHTESSKSFSGHTDAGFESTGLTESAGSETTTRNKVQGRERMDSARRDSGMAEGTAWELQGAYAATMKEAGVRLIDRNLAIRKNATERQAGAGDIQGAETRAMSQSADIVVEILAVADPGAATGRVFRVNALDTRASRQLVSFTSSGLPASSTQSTFVAVKGGFEKRYREPTWNEVGRQLAVETMEALAGSL